MIVSQVFIICRTNILHFPTILIKVRWTSGTRTVEDSCYVENKLTYCADNGQESQSCRYSGVAWGIFIGVPAVLVLVAILVGVIVMKKRNSAA